jgi:peptidoglycan/LPS O-acetylase OafA/YrhL
MSKTYFQGLDGLRGLAAVSVIFGHLELMKKSFGLHNVYEGGGPFFLYLAGHAVTFFFVLSGFLITYLLIKEKEDQGSISIKNFYLKRVLRIWPVYYILFICGFFLLPLIPPSTFKLPDAIPKSEYWNSFFYNLILLPNFSKTSNPIAFQSWSIGVEEQFYIFWPLLVSRIRAFKKLALVMIGIIIVIYLLRASVILNSLSIVNWPFLNSINSFFGESRFDNMAIGGLLAILYYKWPNFKLGLWVKIVILVTTATVLIKTTAIGLGLDNIIAAMSFSGLIFIVIKAKSQIFLENKVLKFLGKISYGLYMYHIVGIILAINLIIFFNPDFTGKDTILNIFLYFIATTITILISTVSYYLIEIKFLKFKPS